MSPHRWLGMLLLFVTLSHQVSAQVAPDHDRDIARAAELLKNDPKFLQAVVDAIKRDPSLMAELAHQPQSKTSTAESSNQTIVIDGGTPVQAPNSVREDGGTGLFSFKTREVVSSEATPTPTPMSIDALSKTMTAASPAAAASGSISRLQIDASTGTSDATIAFAIPFPTSQPGPNNWVNQKTLSLKISAPIDNKDQGSATFASLTGLPNGLTVGGDFTLARTKAVDGKSLYNEVCGALKIKNETQCTLTAVMNKIEASDATKEARDAWDKYLSDHIGYSQIYNAHINVSQTDYKYFTDPTRSQTTDSKIGWTAGGLIGTVFPSQLTFVGAGFDFTHSYKEAKDSASCLTGTTPYISCTIGKFAAPTDQVHRIVSLQTRNVIPFGTYQLPIGLTIAHDLVDIKGEHQDSADMPIYFLHNKDGLFTGGLRLGWTTSDHFIGGIFVGSNFDIWPSKK